MHQLAVLILLAALTVSGCVTTRGQSRTSAGSSKASSRSCASCERMCEVAGDARDSSGAVDRCKADCRQKCQ